MCCPHNLDPFSHPGAVCIFDPTEDQPQCPAFTLLRLAKIEPEILRHLPLLDADSVKQILAESEEIPCKAAEPHHKMGPRAFQTLI